MIEINFCDDSFCGEIYGALTQWDTGQYLRIGGLNTTNSVKVQFSLQNYEGSAVEVESTIDGDFVVAKVPQFILENPDVMGAFYNAFVFICESESASCCKTTRKVKLVIRTRPKPEGYVFTDDEIKTFDQLAEDLRKHIDEDIEAALKDVEIEGVVVDNELSEESENPVENKVVTREILDLRERNAELEESIEKLQIKSTTDKAPFHHITDSANYRVLDFGMEGKTEQKTTEGKNEFNIHSTDFLVGSNIKSAVKENTYMSITHLGEDSYQYENIINATLLSIFFPITLKPNTEYYISGKSTPSSYPISFPNEDDVNQLLDVPADGTLYSRRTGDNGEMYVKLSVSRLDGNLISTYTDVAIMEKCYSDYSYEPYTNGPSPNPEYPQEIELAGVLNEETGRYEHKCCVGNRNFWDVEYASDTNNRVANVPQGGYVGIPIRVGKGNVVTVSYPNTLPTGLGFYAGITENDLELSKNNGMTYWLYHSTVESYIKNTITFSTRYDYIWICVFASKVLDFMQYIGNDLQIEISSSATELLPHASQPFTLTSDRPLTKWDNLVKVDGKWYWDYKQLKLVVDGDDWITSVTDFKGFRINGITLPGTWRKREGYCNQLRVTKDTTITNGLCLGISNSLMYCINNSYYDDTLEDYGLANWKAHLNEHPLEIYTYKDESELVPLLDEEQELLNNLEMYYGVTNVYNEQGCPMWLTYVNDTKLYVDNQIKNAVATTQALILEN